MAEWEQRLVAAEAELREREARALADDWTPAELVALASERDKIACEWDPLAAWRDEQASRRDAEVETRDLLALARDRDTRRRTEDRDEGFADRFTAARDADAAMIDRGESRATGRTLARGANARRPRERKRVTTVTWPASSSATPSKRSRTCAQRWRRA